ncbi:MAG: hypothetical protein FWF56_06170 [Firmicutes bacterium]|nr:hypothetical protein [Bacillota bacterium]
MNKNIKLSKKSFAKILIMLLMCITVFSLIGCKTNKKPTIEYIGATYDSKYIYDNYSIWNDNDYDIYTIISVGSGINEEKYIIYVDSLTLSDLITVREFVSVKILYWGKK